MNDTKKWCPLINLFNIISKMWVLQILRVIFVGYQSFGDIQSSLWKISSKTLSARLKELQNEWFIERKIISEQPLKIRYCLTSKWIDFSKETDNLFAWAKKYDY